MANIGIYTKDVRMIKIHESAVNLCVENASTLKVADKKNYPCFCTWADGKRGAIATDYIEEKKAFIVEIATDRIYACTIFKQDELPSKAGMPLYVSPKGELTGKKEGNVLIGSFMGLKQGVCLFMLQ